MYLGTQPAIGQNRKLDSIAASFNGVLTTFSLTVNTQSVVPSNVYQLFISLGGVLQDPGVEFTANGNQITFTTAPVSGLTFFGVFQGDSITGTPTIADASITTLKLATGLTITNTAGSWLNGRWRGGFVLSMPQVRRHTAMGRWGLMMMKKRSRR